MIITYDGKIFIIDFKDSTNELDSGVNELNVDINSRSLYHYIKKTIKDSDTVIITNSKGMDISQDRLLNLLTVAQTNKSSIVGGKCGDVPLCLYNVLNNVYKSKVFACSGNVFKNVEYNGNFEMYILQFLIKFNNVTVDYQIDSECFPYELSDTDINEWYKSSLKFKNGLYNHKREKFNYVVIVLSKNLELLKKSIGNLSSDTDIIVGCRGEPDIMTYCFERGIKVYDYLYEFNYSRIHNDIIKKACDEYDYAVFVNDDVYVYDDNIDCILMPFRAGLDRDLAVVGSKLLYPDGKIQHAGVIKDRYNRVVHRFKGLSGSYIPSNYYEYMDMVTFAFVAVDLNVFRQYWLDEQYDYDYNDIDYCLRVRKDDYRVLYNPESEAVHEESCTRKVDGKCGVDKNIKKFKKDWS